MNDIQSSVVSFIYTIIYIFTAVPSDVVFQPNSSGAFGFDLKDGYEVQVKSVAKGS